MKADTDIKFALVGWGTPIRDKFQGRGSGMFRMAVDGFEHVRPTAVCDLNPVVLEKAREEFPGIQTFTGFDEMLAKATLDALFIGTPATHHAEFAVKALNRNVNVMSEIPCVASVEEGNALWEAANRSRAIYMTGANTTQWGFVEAAMDLKRKGLLGDPIYVEAGYIHDHQHKFDSVTWWENYEPIRYCTHSLGPVLRIVDEDLEWVSCFDTGSHINNKSGQHDVMAALFRTRSNVVVRLVVSVINYYLGCMHHYRFLTTKGCFERTQPYETFRKDPSERQRTLFYSKDLYGFNNWIELPVDERRVEYAGNPKAMEGHGGADYILFEMFFRAIRQGSPSPIGVREGLRMTLPGIYAAESARRGGELMRIEYPWTCSTKTEAQAPALKKQPVARKKGDHDDRST